MDNALIRHLVDIKLISLNRLAIEFQAKKISLDQYIEFYTMLGYSIEAFKNLPQFKDVICK